MLRLYCTLALVALAASSQSARKGAPIPASDGSIRGSVLSAISGEPLTRARVYLKSVTGETASLAVEADEHGSFAFTSLVPGKYAISAQRDGYLPGAAAYTGVTRLPAVIAVDSETKLRDLSFRLTPWSVIAGHIRFDDAEPANGVLVQIFQDAYSRGRRAFRLVSFNRTNDRGEYRIPGLAPGAYYIAASYDRPLAAEFREHDAADEAGKPLPQFRYATTFYPGAQKLSEALPVHVASAQESSGVDIFLQPVRTVSIRGVAVSGLDGQEIKSPSISLRRLSGDERTSINAAVSLTPRNSGFELRGVTPGPYLLVADTLQEGKRLFARVPVVVTDANIDDMRVLLLPERAWRGSVSVSDAPNLRRANLRVLLEPRSDLNPIASADVRNDGTFTINVVPDEVYDTYIVNAPDEVYLDSVRVANSTVGPEGLSGQMAGSAVPLEIRLSGKDGVLAGRAWTADGTPAPGATVGIVPDPAAGRAHLFKTGSADAYGLFRIRGLAPGRYTAFAYFDNPPCDLYDMEALPACRGRGSDFTVAAGEQSMLGLRVQ